MNNKKGVAGLDIFLSVIAFLFMIGLLVMIFALVGGELTSTDSLYDSSSGSVTNESLTLLNGTANYTQFYNERSISLSSVVVMNTSGFVISSGNYTVSGGGITGASASTYLDLVYVSYSYSYLAVSTALDTINKTTISLSGSVDWFDIIVVLTAVVVLVLLSVVILRSIRGSGLMGSEGGGPKESA